jgi:hypothetical protein
MIFPPLNGINRLVKRSKVVLPHPEGPRSVTKAPRSISKVTSFTAVTTWDLDLKTLLTPWYWIIVLAILEFRMEIEKEGPVPVQGAFSFCFLADRHGQSVFGIIIEPPKQ